jgi:hypothetical protein
MQGALKGLPSPWMPNAKSNKDFEVEAVYTAKVFIGLYNAEFFLILSAIENAKAQC